METKLIILWKIKHIKINFTCLESILTTLKLKSIICFVMKLE
jgi:hypothetical protein